MHVAQRGLNVLVYLRSGVIEHFLNFKAIEQRIIVAGVAFDFYSKFDFNHGEPRFLGSL
jgi:hypothetical protein